ncbi:SCP2 sterol-binding domain-containing protein [Actinoplanes subglobosus]|uniref:SCP2 sterol-binding domain-containing protein n=1 Tax=Actinoplanes subglobosus TaxID=1547892 RepID=A0ABV8IXI7_9ACTN
MLDQAAFAAWVRGASYDELDLLLRGERRRETLDALFAGMPETFRADRAGDLSAVVHWHVHGPAEGAEDVYQVVIGDGRCATGPVGDQVPRLTLRLDAVNFVRMATGNAAAWTLFLRGKLKARGDLGLTRTFPTLFDVPSPA